MIFSLFRGERAKARGLQKLAERTIIMMRRMISEMEPESEERALIEDHMRKRIESLNWYAKFAEGRVDELDRLMSPVGEHYHIYKRSMEVELNDFGSDSSRFAWYIRKIQAP